MATYLRLRTRTQYLRGEEDTAGDTVINDHIQAAIEDIVNKYPFPWARKLTTLSNGDDLPSDMIFKWGMVVVDSDDNKYTQIDPSKQYSSQTQVFWTIGGKFYTDSSDALNVFYFYIPVAMTGDSDVCLVPDGEAVAYLAAAKMYVGDERNVELKQDYEKEANDRIISMWQGGELYSPNEIEGSVLDVNPQITGG